MRIRRSIFAALVAMCSIAHSGEPEMATVPDGKYVPLFRGEKDAKEIAVSAFQLDERPVTNGESLVFVRENPKWQRSQVKRLSSVTSGV